MDSTSSSDSSMDHSMMSMGDMMMTFVTKLDSALYSSAWLPSTTGQYVGSCIFLIVLAAIFRGIVAVRTNFPVLLAIWARRRDTSILRSDYEDGKWIMVPTTGRPWNINEALARAVLDTVLAGVSYLL